MADVLFNELGEAEYVVRAQPAEAIQNYWFHWDEEMGSPVTPGGGGEQC